MTCAEFQKVLPYIIETGGNEEEEQHLRSCPVCSDLVQDLKYIAEQAKLLVPMEDPSPKVWNGIRGSLEREGMIKPARARGRLLGSKSSLPWIGALVLVIVVALGAFLSQRKKQQEPAAALQNQPSAASMRTVSVSTVATQQDDEQLLQHVATSRPTSADSYRATLKQVNDAIADAKKRLEKDPGDNDARNALMRAYQQKAMMYELAMHSLQ